MLTEHREHLRRALIAILAGSPTARFSVSALLDRAKERLPEIRFDELDVEEAIAFLEGLWLIKEIESNLGASKKWQVTSQGILFHERNP